MDMTGKLPVIFFCNDIAVGSTCFVILSVAKYLETALINPPYRQDDNFAKMNRWSTVILLPILSHILHHIPLLLRQKMLEKVYISPLFLATLYDFRVVVQHGFLAHTRPR